MDIDTRRPDVTTRPPTPEETDSEDSTYDRRGGSDSDDLSFRGWSNEDEGDQLLEAEDESLYI
jgi:hypothetical protein